MSLTSEGNTRIESIDVMRGFAILGILVVNAAFFAGPWQAAVMANVIPLAVDETTLWSWLVVHTFFEFKCITLFSMLFGVSIYLVGGERGDKEKGAQVRRRLIWMIVFGLIHGALIWYGDILLNYALWGFPMLLARSWKPLTLMIVGVLLTLAFSGLTALIMVASPYMPPAVAQEQAAAFEVTAQEFAIISAAITGNLMTALRQNFEWWVNFLPAIIFLGSRTIGLMMIGLALFKWGFLSGKRPVWLYLVFLVLGAASFAGTWLQGVREFEAGFPLHMVHGEGSLLLSLYSPFGTLFYISLFILILKTGALGFLMRSLAATGRMAFTNYIAQSLIMTTIFWRLDYFGQVTRPELMVIVGVIWIVQLIWSPLWLSVFTMGPLEWVWRVLTYKRPVALLKGAAVA